MATFELQMKNKKKFKRRLANKINRSLTIISNNSNSFCVSDFHDIDINDDCDIDNDNNNNIMLYKSSCHINDNCTNINLTNNKLLHNIDNTEKLVHDVRSEKIDIPLSEKLAKWPVEKYTPLSSLRNLLSII